MALQVLIRALASLCLPLIVNVAAGANEPQASGTETGVLAGASYRIDMPPNWNHELVVFYHGYSNEQITFKQGDALPAQFRPLIDQGYAVIQSGYSAIGWAIEQDYADTEKLREFFFAEYGKPARSYVMGMSMGGTLAAMSSELKPEVYNGALSLCGVLEPGDRIGQREFALRAAFDYYFPDLLGSLVPVPDAFVPDQATVRKIA
jgi:pimeloyl-ACP methyl ester carboxylesterase